MLRQPAASRYVRCCQRLHIGSGTQTSRRWTAGKVGDTTDCSLVVHCACARGKVLARMKPLVGYSVRVTAGRSYCCGKGALVPHNTRTGTGTLCPQFTYNLPIADMTWFEWVKTQIQMMGSNTPDSPECC